MNPISYTVMPAANASHAYRTASVLQDAAAATPADSSFGGMLGRALQGAVDAGHTADAQAVAAIDGHANLTDVVMAVSKAELALQTTATLRDRMVTAYQDIMRMPI